MCPWEPRETAGSGKASFSEKGYRTHQLDTGDGTADNIVRFIDSNLTKRLLDTFSLALTRTSTYSIFGIRNTTATRTRFGG